ncbi:MAG: ferritin-like domain-containing protein, partial [Gemmatimonadaceae bacterium]
METKQTIFEKVDPEIGDLLVTRRDAIRKGASVSSAVAAGLAIASVPAAIAVLAKDVFGQVPANIVAVLNFALTLEYLEDEFYRTGLAAPVLIPAADRAIFAQISKHEVAHVALLKSVLGSQAVAKPTFDYTAGNGTGAGPFVGVFTVYSTFQAIAQAFEDTGVRAYKGQAGAVAGDDNILTTALQIHSVEARHAAE